MTSPPGPSPATFFDMITSYQRTEALRAGIELDLFTQIATGKCTAAQIASACGAAPRGIRILADYLTIAGVLTKTGDCYALTVDSAAFLDRHSPMYLGGTVEFLLAPNLRDCYAKLTDAVRRGGTAVSDEGTVSDDNPIWVPFARAMGPLMQLPAKLLAGLIPGDPNRPIRVLDEPVASQTAGASSASGYQPVLPSA